MLGHARDEVLAEFEEGRVFLVCNDQFKDGIGSSIAAAARTCLHRFDAMLLTFCDQPLVTAAHLQALIDAWSEAPDEIITSAFADTQGPPALFARDAIVRLQGLRGDEGARALLRDPAFTLRSVHFEDAAHDIDTPADLENL